MRNEFTEAKTHFTHAEYLSGTVDGEDKYFFGILYIHEVQNSYSFMFLSNSFAGTTRIVTPSEVYKTFEEAISGAEEYGVSIEIEDNSPKAA